MKEFKHKAPMMGKEHYVRFAGVVGDFNPVHYDLEAVKGFGMPAVISQGPLTYTLALDALAAEVGLDKLKGFKARISAPVFPDTSMRIECDEDGVVTATDGKKTYLTGNAEAK